jgi:hypothetical protein
MVGLFAACIGLVGLLILLSGLPVRPDPLPDQPESFPPGAIPLSLETAEQMVELAYARSPLRRVSSGEWQDPWVGGDETSDQI